MKRNKKQKGGYNVEVSKLSKEYLVVIIGNDICIDIVCGEIEVSSDKNSE